ncbi:MAG: hypothetical protein FJW63_02385 [Actinobacteria bacterium]|nr:hypothetical protein [Actinomycetota bacterium]
MASIYSHIPNKNEQTVRYMGFIAMHAVAEGKRRVMPNQTLS